VKALKENIRSFRANFHPVESLKRAQKEPTQENERRFFAEIKNARFLVPCVSKSGQPDKRRYPAVLSTQEGEKFLPAFSEPEELEKWPFKRGRVSVFSFDDLKHTILEHPQNLAGIAINPFGKVLLLRQSQIAQIDTATQGMSVQRVRHETGLRLLRPQAYPPGLTGGMKAFFRQKREVCLVYLLLAHGPEESAPHWLFLIDFDGTEAGLFPQVAEAVQPYMKQGDSFELMKATSRLLQSAAAKAKPVYRRRKPLNIP
jgi:hypothetical protein